MKNQVSKTATVVNGTADVKVRKQREIKLTGNEKKDRELAGRREDAKRWRMRQAAMKRGELIPQEAAIRTVHSFAKTPDNYKVQLVDGTRVRMVRNGGGKFALNFAYPDGTTARKGFSNIDNAIKAFNSLIK